MFLPHLVRSPVKTGLCHSLPIRKFVFVYLPLNISAPFERCNIIKRFLRFTFFFSHKRFESCCSSSGFSCVGARLVYWSLRCTATFVIRFHWSLLLAFSIHFSSSSAILRSLFTQSSHLSCGLPRFLQPSCFFFSDLFGSLSSFILTMCPAHFIRLLTILPPILPTMCHNFCQFLQQLHNFMTTVMLRLCSIEIMHKMCLKKI